MGSLRVGHDWATSLSRIGEGNGNPPKLFLPENPRDGGAWWAAVYGVAQSQIRLKWLSSSSSSSSVIITQGHWNLLYLILRMQEKGLPSGDKVSGDTGDGGSILGSGRSPGGGNGNPLQDSCLENSKDREAWRTSVHGVAKSRTLLSTQAHI